MSEINELNSLFEEASSNLQQAFDQAGIPAGGQVTPPELIEAVKQFLYVFDKLDQEHGPKGPIPFDDVNQLGDHAIGFLMDLGVWAERLKLMREKHALESVALGVAHWVIRHEGELRTLEPIVNALAVSANTTDTPDKLKALYHVIKDVIEHVSESIRNDLEKSDPTRPWRILNFNFAIVATRTKDPSLMSEAFDILGRNLPEDCPVFFEQGMKQVQNEAYGSDVKAVMEQHFAKWTTRH